MVYVFVGAVQAYVQVDVLLPSAVLSFILLSSAV